MVVLPSPETEDVTWITVADCCRPENRTAVRRARYASAAGESGCRSIAVWEIVLSRARMMPITGGAPPVARSMSSAVRIASSRWSRTKATPMPTSAPAKTARIPLRTGVGDTGSVGTSARVSTRTPPVWAMPADSSRLSYCCW